MKVRIASATGSLPSGSRTLSVEGQANPSERKTHDSSSQIPAPPREHGHPPLGGARPEPRAGARSRLCHLLLSALLHLGRGVPDQPLGLLDRLRGLLQPPLRLGLGEGRGSPPGPPRGGLSCYNFP